MNAAPCCCGCKCLEYCVWTVPSFYASPYGTIKNIKMRSRAIWWLYLIMMVSVVHEVRLISKNWTIGNKDILLFYCRYISSEQGKKCKNYTFYMWDGKSAHLFSCVPKNGPQSLSSIFNGYASWQNCMCTFANFITFQNTFCEVYFLTDSQCMARLYIIALVDVLSK